MSRYVFTSESVAKNTPVIVAGAASSPAPVDAPWEATAPAGERKNDVKEHTK